MSCIYFISGPDGGYIGRDINAQSDSNLQRITAFPRMNEHMSIAYGWSEGNLLGSEKLMHDVGFGQCKFFAVFGPTYGLNPKLVSNFKKYWASTKDDEELMIDLAEIAYIQAAGGPGIGAAKYNNEPGGQTSFVCSGKTWLEENRELYDILTPTMINRIKQTVVHWYPKAYSNYSASEWEELKYPGILILRKAIAEEAIDLTKAVVQTQYVQKELIKIIRDNFTTANLSKVKNIIYGNTDAVVSMISNQLNDLFYEQIDKTLKKWSKALSKIGASATMKPDQEIHLAKTNIINFSKQLIGWVQNAIADSLKQQLGRDVIIKDINRIKVNRNDTLQLTINSWALRGSIEINGWKGSTWAEYMPIEMPNIDCTEYMYNRAYNKFASIISKYKSPILPVANQRVISSHKQSILNEYLASNPTVNREEVWYNLLSIYLHQNIFDKPIVYYSYGPAQPSDLQDKTY